MWTSVVSVFDRAVRYYGERTAVVDGERSLTYGEMGEWANRVAHGLVARGVQRGDRVGLLMPNCLELIPTLYGVWKSGAAFTQMSARSGPADFRHNLTTVEASVLVYHSAFDDAIASIRDDIPSVREVIRLGDGSGPFSCADYHDLFDGQPGSAPAVEITGGDMALAGYTGGTTGLPKAVVVDHRNWSHYMLTAGMEMGHTIDGERFLHVAPLTHFTLSFVLPTFMRGGTNLVCGGFDADAFFATVERHGVTATALVPTIIYTLLDHPQLGKSDLSTLGTVVYAASPMVPDRLRQGLELLGPVFSQGYGGTEPGYMSCLRKADHRLDSPAGRRRLASAGRPMFHVEISIQDEEDRHLPGGETGEICARSPGQMVRYWDDSRTPEAVRGGWVHSGDIGYLDADGFLYIVDRKKDMIVSGGFNVFPRQIEDILALHPAVAASAVIGVPDPKWGEAVKAFVVCRPERSVGSQELIDMVKAEKGSVWAPKSVEIVGEIPVTAVGKPDKKVLRAPYWEGQARSIH